MTDVHGDSWLLLTGVMMLRTGNKIDAVEPLACLSQTSTGHATTTMVSNAHDGTEQSKNKNKNKSRSQVRGGGVDGHGSDERLTDFW